MKSMSKTKLGHYFLSNTYLNDKYKDLSLIFYI